MKKLASILLVPFMAILLLCGCGETQRNAQETKALMDNKVNDFNAEIKINDNVTAGNWLFNGGVGSVSKLMKVTYSVDNDCLLNQVVLLNDINNIANISANLSGMSTELFSRYNYLRTIYQRELTLIYTYYNYYYNTFFENIDSKDVSNKDMNLLYNKTKALTKQLDSFNISKNELEREVKLFETKSDLLIASIDNFYSSFNNIISKSLDMVKTFRDLHVKYYYKDITTIDGGYATRLYYDALLTLSDFIYKDYLLALENNEVVELKYLAQARNSAFNIFDKNNFLGNYLNLIIGQESDGTALKDIQNLTSKLNVELPTKPVEEQSEQEKNVVIEHEKAVNLVKQFEISLNNFKQQFNLYNRVYGKINMSEYNNHRYKIRDYNYPSIAGSISMKPSNTDYTSILFELGKYEEMYNVKIINNMEIATVPMLLKAFATLY